MPAALLETKLYVPRLRRGVVPRWRLSERLDRGTASTLTLVSAPAGFGKTTLLTEWLAGSLAGSLATGPAAPGDERLAAWLSLDRADNDPVSFWTYVIAALRTVAAGVGDGALAYLQAAQPPPAETVLTVLLNDLGASAADIVLVLDDYHVIDLHRRASAWHERNGELAVAIDHALAARDFERAAGLVELAIPDMRKTRQEAVVRRWLQALPDELIRARPVLAVTFAATLLTTGDIEVVEERLLDAERRLNARAALQQGAQARPAEPGAVEEEYRRLPAGIELYRAALAAAHGDAPGTVRHARRALDLSPAEDHLGRAAAAGLLGLTSWGLGDLAAAHGAWSACVAGLRRAGFVADIMGCSLALADIRITQGRLGEALRTYEQALGIAQEEHASVLRGMVDMHAGMSELYRERDDLAAAARHLLTCQELGEHNGLPQHPYRWRVALARVEEAQGNLAGALTLLDEAERRYVSDFFPNVRPVPALKARVWIAQGRLGDALGWAREQGLSADDDLSYLREFEHITLARVLLAQHGGDQASRLLERLLLAAEEGQRTGRVIEILVLRALAQQALGDIPAALAALERALALAEPEGYVRVFADEGAPMTALLRAAAKAGSRRDYARRLLAAARGPADDGPVEQALIDPLSERELDVLRLLATELNGPAIARELVVSLNTVRTHTKSIYAKLAVTSRGAAVRRAAELGLLPRAGDRRQP